MCVCICIYVQLGDVGREIMVLNQYQNINTTMPVVVCTSNYTNTSHTIMYVPETREYRNTYECVYIYIYIFTICK